jgi:hypothetical protein
MSIKLPLDIPALKEKKLKKKKKRRETKYSNGFG